MRELLLAVASGGQNYVLHYLTHSAVMLAVMGLAAWFSDPLLRRVGPQARHRMWVVALLAGVALPLFPSGWLTGFGAADAGAAGAAATVTYHAIAAATGRWTVPLLVCALLAVGYVLIVLFFLSRLLWRWRRTAAMTRRSAMLPLDARARGLLESAAKRFGVAAPEVRWSGVRRDNMRNSVETRGPVVLGLRRPLLLVPEGFFARESDEDIAAALAHECAHIARRDFAKNLLYELVALAVAYHPACWLMRRRIAETRELVCDEMAAGAEAERPEYASSLLRLATAMAGTASRQVYASGTQAIGVFDADILEERIMRLTMDLPKVSRKQKIAMATVTACMLLGGATTAMAFSFDVMSQTNAATAAAAHEKIYHVGNGVTAPVLTHSVDAEFSKKAKDAKYQGVSVVSCIVDVDGMPRHVHTIRKLGMGLDEKAIEAVRQYRFKPGRLNGKPVAVAITIEVNFRLY